MSRAPRIGLTQRVESVASYDEQRDCLDQRWFRLLERLGMLSVPLGNALEEPEPYLAALELDGAILTGGGDLSQCAGARDPSPGRERLEQALVDSCLGSGLPLMGVCRGMQFMNLAFGGRLEACQGHVSTRHRVEPVGSRFDGAFEVNSYHDFAVPAAGLGTDLAAIAVDDQGNVEALEHTRLPCRGVMWHPERERTFRARDLELIEFTLLGSRT